MEIVFLAFSRSSLFGGLNFILLISSLNIGHGMVQAKSLQRNFQALFLLAVKSEKLLLHFSHIQFCEIKFIVNIIGYIIKQNVLQNYLECKVYYISAKWNFKLPIFFSKSKNHFYKIMKKNI